jgi:hypothetical protein
MAISQMVALEVLRIGDATSHKKTLLKESNEDRSKEVKKFRKVTVIPTSHYDRVRNCLYLKHGLVYGFKDPESSRQLALEI